MHVPAHTSTSFLTLYHFHMHPSYVKISPPSIPSSLFPLGSPCAHRELQTSSSLALARLAEADAKVRTLQSALETTQSELLEVKNKYDEEAHAK